MICCEIPHSSFIQPLVPARYQQVVFLTPCRHRVSVQQFTTNDMACRKVKAGNPQQPTIFLPLPAEK